MNRNLATALVLSVLFLASPVGAQTADDDVQLARAVIQTERQAVVAENLNLSDAEKAIFWPLYKEYRAAVDQATDVRVALLQKYFASLETLTDEEASALLDNFFTYEKNLLKTRMTYAKKMRKVLPGKTVARFFQVENKMDIVVEYQMTGEIPLVE